MRSRDVGLHLALGIFVLAPLLPATILGTRNDDLANHVRFVAEATQALREGQVPPRTTVSLHRGKRIPLFQFYTGSAYLPPGILGLAVDPYTALRLTCLAATLLAALALRAALESLGATPAGAFLGAAALQLAPFGVVDLQQRGAYPEWLALHVGVVFWSLLVRLTVRAPAGAWSFVGAAASGAIFIAAHPLQTASLGPVLAVLWVAAWCDTRLPWRRLGPAFASSAAALMLSAFYWLPILVTWGAQKMPTRRGVFDSAGIGLLDVFWPWFHGSEGLAMQLGTPLALGVLVPLVAWRRVRGHLHVAAVVLALAAALLAGSADAVNTHLSWLAFVLRHYQTAFRFLVPASLCGAIALALLASSVRLRGWMVALALALMGAHASGYVFPGRPWSGSRYAHTVADVVAPGFRVPNASFYALVGLDYGELGWTRARGDLVLHEALPLPRAGQPFLAELRSDAPDLRVFVGQQEVAVAQEAPGTFAFDVRPERQFFIRFESSAPSVSVAALRVRPDGDREWIALPEAVERRPRARPGWTALVRVAQEGPVQLPVAYQPWDRAFVGDRAAPQVSDDRFLWVLRLPAGESVVRVEPHGFLPATLLSFAGALATLAGAWACRRFPLV